MGRRLRRFLGGYGFGQLGEWLVSTGRHPGCPLEVVDVAHGWTHGPFEGSQRLAKNRAR